MRRGGRAAFTLIELLVVVVIIGVLAKIAVVQYAGYIGRARVAQAIGGLQLLQGEIDDFYNANNRLPNDLTEIGRNTLLDPWGTPYEYTPFGAAPPGQRRKDRFLVPINSTYDLFSAGPDKNWVPPLTGGPSRDDIVRANDGGYIGPASGF